MIGLAGLLDQFLKNQANATGEPLPEPMAIEASTTGGIDLGRLTVKDCARATATMLHAARAFAEEGQNEALEALFTDFAGVLADSGNRKLAALTAAGQPKAPAQPERPN